MRSATIAATTAPNAAPITTATARSTRLPRRMNWRKSFNTRGCLARRPDGPPLHHAGREAAAQRAAARVGEPQPALRLVGRGDFLPHGRQPQLRAPEHLERSLLAQGAPGQVDEPLARSAVHIRPEEVGAAVAPAPDIDVELE